MRAKLKWSKWVKGEKVTIKTCNFYKTGETDQKFELNGTLNITEVEFSDKERSFESRFIQCDISSTINISEEAIRTFKIANVTTQEVANDPGIFDCRADLELNSQLFDKLASTNNGVYEVTIYYHTVGSNESTLTVSYRVKFHNSATGINNAGTGASVSPKTYEDFCKSNFTEYANETTPVTSWGTQEVEPLCAAKGFGQIPTCDRKNMGYLIDCKNNKIYKCQSACLSCPIGKYDVCLSSEQTNALANDGYAAEMISSSSSSGAYPAPQQETTVTPPPQNEETTPPTIETETTVENPPSGGQCIDKFKVSTNKKELNNMEQTDREYRAGEALCIKTSTDAPCNTPRIWYNICMFYNNNGNDCKNWCDVECCNDNNECKSHCKRY